MVEVRMAGMAQGTPDWQLDRMYETDTAERLEKAYAEDDFPVSSVESEFSMAKRFLGQAVVHLVRAANEAEKYGGESKAKPIDDLIGQLDDDIPYQMDKVIERYRKGQI